MSFSKEYIEMCKKAVEIQESYRSRIPQPDDIFVGKIYHSAILFVSLSPTNVPVTDDYIWLPRQSQLQKMTDKGLFSLIEQFYEFCHNETSVSIEEDQLKLSLDFTSMEQLWLAFVMYTKFKKLWDSDKKEWKVCSKD